MYILFYLHYGYIIIHNIISKYRDNKCLWDTYSIEYRKITKELQLWIL